MGVGISVESVGGSRLAGADARSISCTVEIKSRVSVLEMTFRMPTF